MNQDYIEELREQNAGDVLQVCNQPDAAARLLEILIINYAVHPFRVWELAGFHLMKSNRWREALAILSALYEHMVQDQLVQGRRVHKGQVLCWMADCFDALGFVLHSKRYLMLTLCEDAFEWKGIIDPIDAGVYFRLVLRHGLSENDVQRYARLIYDHAESLKNKDPTAVYFPEDLLQRLDNDWLTELPSPAEASFFRINPIYTKRLLDQLGDRTGKNLELLAGYLMSCMPGCRVKLRQQSGSTDYDLVCGMEGFDVDFRSEFGRYFVCECKDWSVPADFSVMAKFCRVLDSTKSRFGILFSKNGITGIGRTTDAALEQIKVFQDRGIVIIDLSLADLNSVVAGSNLIALLRRKYEDVRLNLRS